MQAVRNYLVLPLVCITLTSAGAYAHRRNFAAPLQQDPQTSSSALIKAAREGNLNAVKSLMNSGSDPNTRDQRDTEKSTVLMVAAFGGRTNVVEFLIERGADVDAR